MLIDHIEAGSKVDLQQTPAIFPDKIIESVNHSYLQTHRDLIMHCQYISNNSNKSGLPNRYNSQFYSERKRVPLDFVIMLDSSMLRDRLTPSGCIQL